MLLTKVVLNDLGVYRGRNEFDFKTTQEKPVILIGGTNGAGKTTLFESVMLCLYGQDSFEEKKSKKEYQEIIGRSIHRYLGIKKSAEEASVVIEFQFSHEGKIDEFQVIRMWQNNDGRIDETLTIKKKNSTEEEFSKLDSVEKNDWQVFIDQLIPRGIVKLFFFDGEKIQNIAESESEEKHIKTSFDTLLGLDLVKQLGDDIGRTLIRNSKGETKEIEQAIDDNIEERKMREADIEKNKEKIVELNAKIKTLTIQSQNLQDDFNKIGGNFAKKREQYAVDKVKQEAKLEEVEKKIREICADTLPFSLIPNELKELKDEIRNDEKKIEANFEKSILENRFSEISSDVKSKSFLKDVTNEMKDKITKEIDELLKNNFKPKLFIVEYNAKFPPPIKWTITYNEKHIWDGSDYYGASLASFNELFEKNNYKLVCCNSHTGSNAFFVKKEFEKLFEDVPKDINDIYVAPRYFLHNVYGSNSFSHHQSVKTINKLFEQ